MRLKQAETTRRVVTGRKISEQGRKNISLSKMGSKHPGWKGDNVGYKGLHCWISSNWGRLKECEQCGIKKAKKFEWANITSVYDRNKDNWKRMCCSCHAIFDKKILNIKRMN